MWKRFLTYIKETIQEEYKFIIFLILLYIIFQYPVNYYVIVGGGISNVNSRIKVDNSYSSKGSFNIRDRKSTRLNSSHRHTSRMPSSA